MSIEQGDRFIRDKWFYFWDKNLRYEVINSSCSILDVPSNSLLIKSRTYWLGFSREWNIYLWIINSFSKSELTNSLWILWLILVKILSKIGNIEEDGRKDPI